MKKYDVVVSGYICVDLVPDFKKNESIKDVFEILKPGRLIEIDGLQATLGGVVANTGIAMKQFSKNVFFNARIGNDFIGEIARKWIEEKNLTGNIKPVGSAGTAFGLVISPPGVDRIFLEYPGCSEFFDNSCIDFEAIAQSKLFHFGYPPLLKQFYLNKGAQLIDLFSKVQRMGVVTSMDFSLSDENSESDKVNWPDILEQVLPLTDIFVPSLEEALQIVMPSLYAKLQSEANNKEIIDLISMETIQAIGKRLIEGGVKIALIKAGHRGAYLWTGNVTSMNKKPGINLAEKDWNFQELWCNSYPVDYAKVKNASGAGDTAAAAFLSAILNGESPESSLKYAAFAGRNNLYCFDIYNEMCGWKEMKQGIKHEANPVINLKQLKYE